MSIDSAPSWFLLETAKFPALLMTVVSLQCRNRRQNSEPVSGIGWVLDHERCMMLWLFRGVKFTQIVNR